MAKRRIVIFTGGETCSFEKGKYWVNSKPNDFIIAADSGFENCLNFQEKPNLLIGDFDSINKELIPAIKDFEVREWPKDKDFTDTELALIEAKKYQKDSFIILVGGDGGRLDHLFGIKHIFETENYPNIWVAKNQIALCLDFNSDFKQIKIGNINPDDVISVFPVFAHKNEKYKIESHNLKWSLNDVKWEENQISLSNRLKIQNDDCKFSAKYGRFLIFVPLHSKIIETV